MRSFPQDPSIRTSVSDADVQKVTDAFIHKRLPSWITGASADDIATLRTLMANHQLSRQAVQDATAGVVPLHTFAEKTFSEGLASILPGGHELSSLDWQKKVRTLVGTSVPRIEESYVVYPALQRLMQNFAEGETPLDGSGLVVKGTTAVVSGNLERVIQICRTLDAGAQYQALLKEHFRKNQALLAKDKYEGFKLAVHVAFLKNIIDDDVRIALEHYAATHPVGTAQQTPAGAIPTLKAYPGLMSMLQVLVHEALFIQLRTADGTDAGVVAYLPGPSDALSWYESKQLLVEALVTKLKRADDQRAFLQRIALKDRETFYRTLQQRLLDASPDLEIDGETGGTNIFEKWALEQCQRAEEDAKVLLVPNADADSEASHARMEQWKSMGWGLVGLAGFFIPAVGAVMLAQLVVQVCTDVYEGVSDWAKGHDHEALQHALSVAETVAAAAVTTGVVVGAGAAVRQFTRSAVVDGLEAVELEDGTQRLWSDQLSVYQSPVEGAELKDDGLYSKAGRRWVGIDGRFYEVHQPKANGPWRLRHPRRPDAYGPVIESNEERLWMLHCERPLQWNDAVKMLARLWPQQRPLDQQRAKQVLQAACSDVDELRAILVENRALPASLRDTLRRFEADERIERFFTALGTEGAEIGDQALLDWCAQRPGMAGLSAAERPEAFLEQQVVLRRALFEHLTYVDAGDDAVVALIRRDFPGLPTDHALELSGKVSLRQREEIELLRRLPLEVSTEARALLQLARLSRAQQGLMLRNAYSQVSDEVTIEMLSRLPMWVFNRQLELRAGSAEGRLLAIYNSSAPDDTKVVLARKNERFWLYDDQGVALEEQSSVPDDIFHTVSCLLTPEQRASLNPGDEAGYADALRRAAVQDLPKGRQKLLDRFGWGRDKGWFNPGQRLPDGRVGYPLGGAVSTARSPRSRLARRIAVLYQGDTPNQLEGHLFRLLDSPDPFEALLFEEDNLRMLNARLHAWIDDASEFEAPMRRLLADRLRQAWRRQLSIDMRNGGLGFVLDMSGYHVTSLPELDRAIDFHHVTTMVMINTPLQTVADGFFSCFRYLRRLNMASNCLSEMPTGLRHLTQLERLQLSGNRIRIAQQPPEPLRLLAQLQELDLSFNPIRRFELRFDQVPALRRLSLRRCSLLEWPGGLELCRLLESVDLSSNTLTDVPETILQLPYAIRSGIRLNRNSISPMQLSRLYRRPPLPEHFHQQAVTPRASSREVWVTGQGEQRIARWDRLFAGTNAAELQQLLFELQGSADYRNEAYRADLTTRVWALLDAMDADAELAGYINTHAREITTCVDSVAERFSELHLHALVVGANRAGDATEEQLLKLGLGLYRLDRLKTFIRRDIAERIQLNPALDQIEASLYYLVTLAKEMDLPGQPSSMTFVSLGENGANLDAARDYVNAEQGVEARANFLAQQEFWRNWMEKQHETDYAAIDNDFQSKGDELFDRKAALTDLQYTEQFQAIQEERETELKRLTVLLTTQVLESQAV